MLKGEQYCITPENLAVHEMIGLKVEVKSNDKNKNGMNGKIVDESMNTMTIESKGMEKVIPKKEVTFTFTLGNEKVGIEGKKIIYRPEQRTKALWGKSI
ncbi:MAG: ribonuclease P [Candidatus Diapherotrites archaeon CG11_big_fil_rev_8_21_14_0_20_37_9]|nr:MAG: ribonuclease P [Candidatus Diapherotrites archaeon CG11_big_fil_rev_8_21_14_0_20_37_9]